MALEEQKKALGEVLEAEPFAVFAFAGKSGAPPYTSILFFAAVDGFRLVFGTTPDSFKGRYLSPGNGACAQIDNRGIGLANMSEFARVTVQGTLQRIEDPAETARLHEIYFAKLPNAKPFFQRPGVETWLLEPVHLVFSRGLGERLELDSSELGA
ncbi:MAG: pyridoxamine 5'-phosphate oxidase family protein [bacterium]|nr:pyridoxamine 5'-phosphate oxidase family protein [bacterium]